MSLITSRLRQKLVRWPKTGFDNYGQPEYGSPVELSCRWVDKPVEYIDSQGTRQVSTSMVELDTEVYVGDLIRLGTLTSLASLTVPKDNTGVWEIRSANINPDIRNVEKSVTVYL